MENLLNSLKSATNYILTENGAITHKSTLNPVLDMFALGGAYRNRSDEDCITLFKKAFQSNEELAMKCLFYLRDVRGGQGERRFFRVCFRGLAEYGSDAAARNLKNVPEFGRWDDLIYTTINTPLQNDAYEIIKHQFTLDLKCETPSLLAKWLPSENASAAKTKKAASSIRNYLGLTHKEYRKALSVLRARINVLEKLMSQGRWDEIEFDKIPSKAGMKYRNAFAHKEITAARYATFMKSKNTKVNAGVLNPVDIAHQIFHFGYGTTTEIDRQAWQKYWDNLKDYYNGRVENGIAIVDVSGSMSGTPMEAAVSMGAYIAERGKGPFKNHFITFSNSPELVEFEGVDIYDKFRRAVRADWGGSTNIEATFDLMLNTALTEHIVPEDMPERLYIFSDMEFNHCISTGRPNGDRWGYGEYHDQDSMETLLEGIAKKWANAGYKLPHTIFWNLDARQDNVPALGGRFSYISGFSMNMVEQILSGKDGIDIMLDKLGSERYKVIC